MIKAAVIQMCSGLSPSATAVQLEPIFDDVISKGANYIQTPEMTGCLHKRRAELLKVLSDADHDPVIKLAKAKSREHNVVIHIGSTAIPLNDGKVANRAFVFENGALLATYDKIHMFDVDLDNGESWRESNTYKSGGTAKIINALGAKVGLGICYDVRFAELFKDQALGGAQILTAPAAFTKQTGEAHWHILQRARAIENGAFMVSAAQGGMHEDGRETYGHSIIVDPWGKVLAEVDGDMPGYAIADIDLSLSTAARAKIPNLKNIRDYVIKSL